MYVGAPMADRSVAKPGEDPEETREIVELDKDERWQSRLEEARARREIALREKANQPPKKRKKPWEEDSEDDLPPIEPIIQAKPDDEPDLDFADRIEVMRETAKDEAPEIETAPPPPPPERKPEPKPTAKVKEKADPKPKPRIERTPPPPKVHDFDEAIPPAPTPVVTAPAPQPASRRQRGLVSDDAPNVYDLAQRYAATLKPPENVTRPFDPIYSEPTPEPEPIPVEPPIYTGPPLDRRNRRPFGLGLVVLAFSLVPLAQMAPPLEKGPEQPPTPFFGLPPALGLNTSLVWRPETYPVAPALPVPPSPALGPAPAFETLLERGGVSRLGHAPRMTPPRIGPPEGQVTWSDVTPPQAPGALAGLAAPTDTSAPSAPPPMQSPRPQPKSRALTGEPEIRPASEPESDIDVQTGTVIDAAPEGRTPETLGEPAPDVAPAFEDTTPGLPNSTLNVTILVPEGADPSSAEKIARDAQALGHSLNRIRPVGVNIREPNVRFFHNDDRPAATRLARSYGVEVKDFTWFRPSPEKGTAEVWLSGSAGDLRPQPPRATEPEPPVVVIRRKPTLLERFLTGSDAEIEIILPNPGGLLDGADAPGDN